MKIILADTELELVPQVIKEDKEWKSIEKRYGEEYNSILNYSIHKELIEKYYPDKTNRIGRPFIPYIFTRMNQETLANNLYDIDYAIHTKQGCILEKENISGFVTYEDFLFGVARMMRSCDKSIELNHYLDSLKNKNIYIFHPKAEFVKEVPANSTFVIGGFPEGDFISDISSYSKIRLNSEETTVPAILEMFHFSMLLSKGSPYIHFSFL